MKNKLISSNAIIAKIYRDFKPSNSAWITDAFEWIGEAIEIMGSFTGYEKVHTNFNVIDYRVKLPCDIEQLIAIEYKGRRLQRNGNTNGTIPPCVEHLPSCIDESYSLNPNYIETTFPDGCITIHYERVPVDCDGFPMIIDRVKTKNAITWYILSRMILRGFKHQTIPSFDYANAQWEKYYPQAQNDVILSDIDDMELFKKSWLGLVKNTNLTNEFFNTVVSEGNITKAVPPGTLVPNALTIVRESDEEI